LVDERRQSSAGITLSRAGDAAERDHEQAQRSAANGAGPAASRGGLDGAWFFARGTEAPVVQPAHHSARAVTVAAARHRQVQLQGRAR